MSRVAPASGEKVEATPRRSMTPARRKRILARHGDVCAYPECEIVTGLEVDHIVCLELGGRDVDDNCEGLCAHHHKIKTARDLKLIAKARRIRKRDAGIKPRKGRSLSHPFLRKRMDGVVVPR